MRFAIRFAFTSAGIAVLAISFALGRAGAQQKSEDRESLDSESADPNASLTSLAFSEVFVSELFPQTGWRPAGSEADRAGPEPVSKRLRPAI
jgi:hypothetical protein